MSEFYLYTYDQERAERWKNRFPEAIRKRVRIYAGIQDKDLTAEVQNSRVAVLPFRDGCSTRRTTVLSMMGLGVPIITLPPLEPPFLPGEGILPVQSVPEFLSAVQKFSDPDFYREQSLKARQLASQFSPGQIAEQYISVYNILRKQ